MREGVESRQREREKGGGSCSRRQENGVDHVTSAGDWKVERAPIELADLTKVIPR